MFEDSLIESGGRLKTKRGWTSIVSFLIQFMIIGVMVLIPLIFTEALPKTITLGFLVAPPPPPPPPPPPAAAPVKIVKQIQTDIVNGELRTPTKIPKKIQMIKEDEAPQRVRVSSGVQSGLLVRKVPPAYPPLARQARIQGTVILQAQISKDGNIENLQLISGHPMLAPAAIEAVKQWKYKPYLLNGEPVEVETQVQVNFTLAGG
jgi:protein TonB